MRRIGKKSRGEGQWEGAWSFDNKCFSFSIFLSLFAFLLFFVFLFFLFFWQIPDFFVWWGNEKKLRRLFILDLVFSREGAEVFNLIFYLLLFLLLSLQRVSC